MLTYFALTFAISWGGVLILGAPYGMPATSDQSARLWPLVFLPYFLGPSLAGLLMVGLVHGRAGYRDLRSRLTKWRVGARWHAAALMTAPLLILPTLYALSLTSAEYLPVIVTSADKVGPIVTGLVVGLLFGGFMEELGWTGFAVPGLRRRHGVIATGALVGALWGIWHFLPTFWASGDASGQLDWAILLPPCAFYAGVLPAYRVLMVRVYDRTGSLLVAMLMHASLTANSLFVLAPSVQGGSLILYYVVLSAIFWAVVAAVAVAGGGRLSLRALPGRSAE